MKKLFSNKKHIEIQSLVDYTILFALKLRNNIVLKPASNKRERGQGLVEYAIVLALVAIVVIATMKTLGLKIDDVLASVTCHLNPNAVLPTVNGITPVCSSYL